MRLSSLGGGAAAGSGLLGSLGGALGSDFLSSSSNSLG